MTEYLSYLGPILTGFAAILTGFAGIAGAISRGLQPEHKRRRLKHDAELLAALPADGEAARSLSQSLDRRMAVMLEHEETATRQVALGVIALIFTLASAYGTYWMATREHWLWWIGAVALGLFGLGCAYGVGDSFVNAPRDEKGNRLEDETSA